MPSGTGDKGAERPRSKKRGHKRKVVLYSLGSAVLCGQATISHVHHTQNDQRGDGAGGGAASGGGAGSSSWGRKSTRV